MIPVLKNMKLQVSKNPYQHPIPWALDLQKTGSRENWELAVKFLAHLCLKSGLFLPLALRRQELQSRFGPMQKATSV